MPWSIVFPAALFAVVWVTWAAVEKRARVAPVLLLLASVGVAVWSGIEWDTTLHRECADAGGVIVRGGACVDRDVVIELQLR